MLSAPKRGSDAMTNPTMQERASGEPFAEGATSGEAEVVKNSPNHALS